MHYNGRHIFGFVKHNYWLIISISRLTEKAQSLLVIGMKRQVGPEMQ